MDKKIAVVHDWLNGMRGGEKVLEQILHFFPEADIFTLFYESDKVSEKISQSKVYTSRLNRIPGARRFYKHLLPLFPAAIEDFDLGDYDLVISTSHCVAKGAVPHPDASHISYIHSPMRYIWDQYSAYFGHTRGLKRLYISNRLSSLRVWDVASSARVDTFIANSNFIRKRIWKYYRRDAEVVHPPVDIDFYKPGDESRDDYFLVVSALVPYKKVDYLIETFNHSGKPLVIVGSGSEEGRLKHRAAGHISFRKNLSAEELRRLYRRARALVFAGIEDFGITFVEALACGTPVVAYKRGGVADIVTDGEHGILFDSRDPADIQTAIDRLDRESFDSGTMRERCKQFSVNRFRENFIKIVNETQ